MSLLKIESHVKLSLFFLAKWLVLALIAGIVGPVTVHGFAYLLEKAGILIAKAGIPIWIWPAAGAALAVLLVFRLEPDAAEEGLPSYIKGLRTRAGNLRLSVTLGKFWAALITLAAFGNGGIVGPLGRVSAGLMTLVEGWINSLHLVFDNHDRRTAAICGMAAAVSAIFHTSIGAGLFAVEIIQRKNMGYRDLFPAILSGSISVYFCKFMGWGIFYPITTKPEFMDVSKIGWLFLLAVAVGATGGAYSFLYRKTSKLFNRRKGRLLPKALAGMMLSFGIAWFINPALLSTSNGLIDAIFTNNMEALTGRLHGLAPIPLLIVAIIFLKLFCNCLCVGSGMSAGFAGPAIIAGMLLGVAVARISGVPFDSPTYYAFLAAGFAGMLASCMNVPLAAAVMAVEVFGMQYSFPAGFAAILGFQVTRHKTLYDYALEDLDK